MKKILLFAAIAAAMLLASCQKEVPVETVNEGVPSIVAPSVFTATISPGTKTTVTPSDGKVSWEMDDEITIIDKASKSATYSIESIDGSTGRATFKYKSGETLGVGPYKATYGEEPSKTQTYYQNPGKLYMKAESDTTILNFQVQCGLLEINLTKNGEFVKSIAVSNYYEKFTYTLTCNPEKDISEKETFYIAVNGDTYYKIVITDKDGKECVLKAASGIKVDTNHIKPVTLDEKKLVFKSNTLPGVFSVSDNKKIQFSKGNLYWDETNKKFGFEANQYDFQDKWYGTYRVSHFYWSKTASVTYVKDYNDSGKQSGDVFFTNTNDFTVNGVTGKYRTLSKEEWLYLFGFNEEGDPYPYEQKTPRYKKYKCGVTVCGVNDCVVLKPDDYTGASFKESYDKASWAEAEAAGLVCLPASGYRDTSSVKNCGSSGSYWSSSAIDAENAYYVGFPIGQDSKDINVNPDPTTRNLGNSVRLVTDVQ